MTDRHNLILILEDSANRLTLMREALESLSVQIEICHWDNAWAMKKEAVQWLAQACLISLDFDLSNSPVRSPGDGLDAVQMLKRHKPVNPVIVQTSLAEDDHKMVRALRSGWLARRAGDLQPAGSGRRLARAQVMTWRA